MIALSRFTLDNGLRVVHNYDPSSAMVAVNLLYNVGSRDENPSRTGLAHLFEHLMFGGSVNIPDFDKAIEAAGGVNNAWTSNDFTNFYDVLPAVNAETAFWLESDRMLSPSLTEKSLEVQRGVVIEEFKQVCLNRPYGDMAHYLRAMAFDSHPYRYPTIGLTPDHIAETTRDEAREFFFTHYAPNNAVLAISGNITLERTRELTDKWFASVPRRPIAPRTYSPAAPVEAPRLVETSGNVPQTSLTVAFRMPAHGERGYIECDLITDLLASGRSSRFFRDIVMEDPLFTTADASILGSDEPGLLMLSARLTSDAPADIDRARRKLIDEAMRLTTEPPGEHELLRAQNRFDSNTTFSTLSYLSKAQSLAMCEMQGEDINTTVAAYRAVTPADVTEVAREIINPDHAMTLIYHPANAS